jgi:hypothetical protein
MGTGDSRAPGERLRVNYRFEIATEKRHLGTGCLLKENGVTDVEACVPVPPRV